MIEEKNTAGLLAEAPIGDKALSEMTETEIDAIEKSNDVSIDTEQIALFEKRKNDTTKNKCTI